MALNLVRKIDNLVPVRHVLISTWDKTGLEDLVQGLLEVNPSVKIYSTGGTYTAIERLLGAERAGKTLVAVSEYTGQPEMQGGLVKTLDFKIYLGLLSETYNEAHRDDLARVTGVALDMVVVNLYPFQTVVAQADVTPESARTHIDIGGPCMVRAGAKNYLRVASVTDPADYPRILNTLRDADGSLPLSLRLELARKAFATTARYDEAIAAYLADCMYDDVAAQYELDAERQAAGGGA